MMMLIGYKMLICLWVMKVSELLMVILNLVIYGNWFVVLYRVNGSLL